tara:strand:- start:1323 stop:1457 length:135 start_codon:yes stop_codon:yes gene_type:complete
MGMNFNPIIRYKPVNPIKASIYGPHAMPLKVEKKFVKASINPPF